MKIFPFDGFREHFIQCQKDMLNNNNNLKTEFSSEKLKLKIIKGKLKTDEVGKPYLEYIMDISYNGLCTCTSNILGLFSIICIAFSVVR